MPVPAAILVLASACLQALWNALLKQARDIPGAAFGVLGISVLATACLVPAVRGPVFPDPRAWPWSLAAGIAEGCYFLALGQALRAAPLGWSFSWMRGVGLLLVWPVSIRFLGESLAPVPAGSALLVGLGLACLGPAPRGPGRGRALAWACVTGACIAAYTLCYKLALANQAQPVGLYAVAMAVAFLVQTALRVRPGGAGLPALGVDWARVVAAGVLCTASFLLYLEAVALQGVGLMSTLRNTSVVFAVLLGWLSGESPRRRQWAGSVLVAAGALGLAWLGQPSR